MRSAQRRWLAIGVGALLVGLIASVVAVSRQTSPPALPQASAEPPATGGVQPPSPSPAAGAGAGPVVYYEIVDATASRLFERTLDGRSAPREIASRQDVELGPAWSVDPTGRLAVVVVPVPGRSDRDLVAYRVADGTIAWIATVGVTQADWLRWSADGRSLGVLLDTSDDGGRAVALVDTTSGALERVDVPNGAWLLGYASDGAAIVWDAPEDGRSPSRIRFFRIDPGTSAVERLTTLPDAGPGGSEGLALDPAIGVAIDIADVADVDGAQIRLSELRSGATRVLASLPSVDLLAIDPAGTGVVAAWNGTIRYIAFDGSASDIFSTDDSVAEMRWSADGAYLLVGTGSGTDPLTVVERASGRGVSLPLPRVAEAHVVAMPAGPALPEVALPAAPEPSPPSAAIGADIAGVPPLLVSWTAREDARLVAHAERLVPTDAGGVRVAAEMPSLDLGPAPAPDDESTTIGLLPRPGSAEILVWITAPDGSRGVVWDGARGVSPLELPDGWPEHADDVAWRPDGGAIAASVGEEGPDGDFRTSIAIATPGGDSVTELAFPTDYDRLEGWWSDTELRLGHVVCTEGCPGRYSFSARLRLADRQLRPLEPGDRGRQPIDSVSTDGGALVLTMISEAPATDIRIAWPAGLGPEDVVSGAMDADGRSVIASRKVGSTTELYRIDDVIGRAVAGWLRDPRPVRIGTIRRAADDVRLAPGDEWAAVRDRVGDLTLVRIGDGREWPLPDGADATWVTPR